MYGRLLLAPLQKLKKLIKAHTKHLKAEGAGSEGGAAEGGEASAPAAAGTPEPDATAPGPSAEPAAAAGAAAVPAAEHAIAEEDREFISTLNEVCVGRLLVSRWASC